MRVRAPPRAPSSYDILGEAKKYRLGLVYGGIVAQLKGAGQWLLIAAGQNPKVLEFLGIQYDDLAARVKELSWDDDWAENPLSQQERDQLSTALGG